MNKFADLQTPALDTAGASVRRFAYFPICLLLVFLLAAGLRFYRLDAQSFWNDEGNSARIAERSIQLILEGAAGDIHPPLYYLALHFWRSLVGQSEFALRSLSAVGGIGLVALVYLLGDRLFGRLSGLVAAFLAAINPFQLYYSQEARSYIWVALLGAAAVYVAWRKLENFSQAHDLWSAGYVLVVTAGLYTHYLFLVVLVSINLVALFYFLKYLLRHRAIKPLGRWVALHLVVGLLYLPWAPIAFRQLTTWPSSAGGVLPGPALLEIFHLLSLGLTIDPTGSVIALLGFGFLLLLGLIPRFAERKSESTDSTPPGSGDNGRKSQVPGLLLVTLWLLAPVFSILALNLYKDAFLKFMLVASPAFCLLIGRGVGRHFVPGPLSDLSRTRFPALFPLALSLGLVLSFSYESLHNLYFDPAYARADYRGMARTIQSVSRPGDAVILDAANQWEVFTYYYPDVERVYPLPRQRPVREPEVVAELERIVAAHDRLYVLFWAEAESDPERVVERWLDVHAYKATDEWWGDVRLVTYAVPAAPAAEMDVPLDARLDDAIALRGYTLLADRLSPADIIQVTLFWEALAPIDQRYKVFLHLLDRDGALAAQRDSEPGGGFALTPTWEPGEIQVDNHGVMIPVGTRPGEYQLIVGLYPLGDPTARPPVTLDNEPAGDVLPLALITVSAP
jgi:4-amino-4-deoxy-L-arabinose transferase-like glycosyltransferase